MSNKREPSRSDKIQNDKEQAAAYDSQFVFKEEAYQKLANRLSLLEYMVFEMWEKLNLDSENGNGQNCTEIS